MLPGRELRLPPEVYLGLKENLPNISEIFISSEQPADLSRNLGGVSDLWFLEGVLQNSASELPLRQVKANQASAFLVTALTNPQIRNLEKLKISRVTENKTCAIAEIVKNNPLIKSFEWPRSGFTPGLEYLKFYQNLKNLTRLHFASGGAQASDYEWRVIGRELRTLFNITGEYFSKSHLLAFVSEMPDNYTLQIFTFNSPRYVSQHTLGKHLASKCPNLKIGSTNQMWTQKALQVWGRCPCYLTQMKFEGDILYEDISEYLSKRGKNLLELEFSPYGSVLMNKLEMMKIPEYCPVLRRLHVGSASEQLQAKFGSGRI
jgi:hypothetical protein